MCKRAHVVCLLEQPLHSRRFVMDFHFRIPNVRRGRDWWVEVVGVDLLLRVGWP